MTEGLAPFHLAMVVCDAIHVDPATGKRTLLGTFSAIHSGSFPATVPGFAVYVSITDCRGKFPAILQVIDVDEEREPVVRLAGEVETNDPLMILEIDFRLGPMEFPDPGEYRVQFFTGGNLVVERRLFVMGHVGKGDSNE